MKTSTFQSVGMKIVQKTTVVAEVDECNKRTQTGEEREIKKEKEVYLQKND